MKVKSRRLMKGEEIPEGTDLKNVSSPATTNLSLWHQDMLERIVFSVKDQKKKPSYSKRNAVEKAIELLALFMREKNIIINPVPEDALLAGKKHSESISQARNREPRQPAPGNSTPIVTPASKPRSMFADVDLF